MTNLTRLRAIFVVALAILLASCVVHPPPTPQVVDPPPTPQADSREIVLDGITHSVADLNEFNAWYCTDSVVYGPILIELGYFDDPPTKRLGFLLYDGGNSGDIVSYRRNGLEHRWDWGPHGDDYAFLIMPDGRGAYYDFSAVPEGQTARPSARFLCRKR